MYLSIQYFFLFWLLSLSLQGVLFLNALPFVWNLSGSVIGYFGLGTEYEVREVPVLISPGLLFL